MKIKKRKKCFIIKVTDCYGQDYYISEPGRYAPMFAVAPSFTKNIQKAYKYKKLKKSLGYAKIEVTQQLLQNMINLDNNSDKTRELDGLNLKNAKVNVIEVEYKTTIIIK